MMTQRKILIILLVFLWILFLGSRFAVPQSPEEKLSKQDFHWLKDVLNTTRGSKTFSGKIVVLLDSESGSAAELFARVMQLEKRGIVVGDRSSGKVMEGRLHPHDVGTMKGTFTFAVSITEADLLMVDGRSLENVGVIPDERVIPLATDLAVGRDPVLARGAELASPLHQLPPEPVYDSRRSVGTA